MISIETQLSTIKAYALSVLSPLDCSVAIVEGRTNPRGDAIFILRIDDDLWGVCTYESHQETIAALAESAFRWA